MAQNEFSLAGAELDWPIGSAAGLTNHPDIEIVANRFENIVKSGVSFAVLGGWTLGEVRSGSGYIKTDTGWDYIGGDEHYDIELGAGWNAKSLPGPGTDTGLDRLDDLVDIANSRNVEVGLNLSPHSGNPVEELKELLEVGRKALNKGVLFVEINLSCPNIPDRPPFYQDLDGVLEYYAYKDTIPPLVNKHGRLGSYEKFGPFEGDFIDVKYFPHDSNSGGLVTSNTLGNQEPKLANGEPAIKVNNGKAGMSGPALKELGFEQTRLWVKARERLAWIGGAASREIISVLGVSTGQEVKRRLVAEASAVELGSVLYWPELVGCESPAEVVEQIKQEILEAA